ncbi:MAG: 3-octaprenyl-4-hydroxybenzoate carboxy-lyase, partial [Ferruginibacter sp.]
FQTNTTIDTLDYSGSGLNSGSKVILAAYGDTIRELDSDIPEVLKTLQGFENPKLIMPGVVALQTKAFTNYEMASQEMEMLNTQSSTDIDQLKNIPLIVICDSSDFTAQSLNNFLWVTFTRCNPSHDMYGINSFTENKHWGCHGPLIFDARIKPHHAPPVEKDAATEKKIDRLFEKGGSLCGVL